MMATVKVLIDTNIPMSQKRQTYQAVQSLVGLKIPVVPIRPNGKETAPNQGKYGHVPQTASAIRTVKTVNKWFDPDDAKAVVAGWNIGVACGAKEGDGIMVLDLDVKGEHNGVHAVEDWEKQFSMIPITPTVRTPSGGLHYYFKWDDRLRNCSLAKLGIDLKSGTYNSYSSHVVAPPSTIEGKPYLWEVSPMDAPVAEMPQWLVDQLIEAGAGAFSPSNEKFASGNDPRGDGRGNENVASSDLEQHIPLEQIRRMLSSIDPNKLSYDEWIKALMSIHSQYPGDDGLEVADQWSQQGERYKRGEVNLRWKGFKPGGTIRIGTLFYMADQAGWEPTKEDVRANPATQVLEELNRLYPLVTVGNKVRMVRVNPEDGDINALSITDVKILYDNKKVEITDGDKIKKVNPVELWRGWKHRCQCDGMGLYPPPRKCPTGYRNLWTGFPLEAVEGDTTPFTDFVREIICNGNQEYADWLHDWCAQLFQEPGLKVGTALALRGSEGTGKNTFTNTLRSLLPQGTFTEFTDTDMFINQFNGHILNNLVLVANEAMWSGNHKAGSKLKGLITEPTLRVQFKGVDTFEAQSCSRVIILTNEEWSVPAGHESRRYFALKISSARKGDSAYWGELHKWLEQKENRQALLHFFLNRKITGDLRKAPVTDELREQRAITTGRDMTLAHEVLFELVRTGKATKLENGNWAGHWCWTNGDIKQVAAELNGGKSVSSALPTQIRRLLKNHGLELALEQTKIHGKNNRVNLLPQSPAVTAECLHRMLSLEEGEVEVADEWQCEGF